MGKSAATGDYRPPSEEGGALTQTITIGDGDGAPMALTCRRPEDEMPKAFVIFCHGLGASGRDYAELSRFWASHGYLVIHPTFPDWVGAVAAAEPQLGFDPNTETLAEWASIPELRARMYEILHTPSYWLERVRIVRLVMAEMDAVLGSALGTRARPIPGAIAGHSFGAYTSQLFAGAEIDVPGQGTCRFKDDRFRAAILLSAQGRDQQGLRKGSWDGMTGPVLNVTGTLDEGAKGQDLRWKVEPYKLAPAGSKYLAVLEGADHYLGGLTLTDPASGLPHQRNAVSQLTLAFLDAYVTDYNSAKLWLASIPDHIGTCPLLFKQK
ncbi:alpha/beta hydrolase family protein [Chelativorans xinjiangense]|uniref:alpha/beta hydrolase family protein n=1 Tax=Chelativorans xinjiangense TaxID=2681485 RepID=UPI001357B1F7|nr:hypothetical protein [Chelativorans xinjiangense]